MTFVKEACEAVDVLGAHYVKPSYIRMQPDIQSLTDYFSRPRAIGAGTIAPGLISRFYTADVNSQMFAAGNLFPNGFARLTGVYGIRFSLVFTIQINANPFVQGVLAASWQYETQLNDTTQYVRSNNSASCTNLPHVRIDFSASTMATLKVPYLNLREFLPIGNPDSQSSVDWVYGLFAINTLLPARSGTGASDCGFRVLLHLEDLEFISASPHDQTSVVLQGGKTLSPVAEEFENDAHPYSSAVHAASRAMTWISRGVPSLSSVAGPTAWFLGKAAGIMRYLGFSKPQIQDPVVRMHATDSVAECNVDLPSATIMVGPFASNALAIDPKFAATEVDEMALSYVLGQWGQIRACFISTSLPLNTLVYVTPVSPSCFWYRSATGSLPYCNIPVPDSCPVGATYNSFMPSHVCNFSSMFGSWRGDLEFRFTFAKTNLHSGRVMVTFTPDTGPDVLARPLPTVNVVSNAATGVQPFGYSAIFDLRDGSVFTFDVPYVSETPYLDFFGSAGALTMHIADPLMGSSTVSTTVGLLVEVRAKPSFELAYPIAPMYPAHTRGTILQGGKVISTIGPDASQACVGEHISSLKQLIMIPKWTSYTVAGATYNLAQLPYWFYQPQISVLTPGPSAYPKEAFGFGGNIAACYAYVRGSSDYHAYVTDPDNVLHGFYNGTHSGSVNTAITTPLNRTHVNTSRVMSSQGAVHVRFPAYQRTARLLSQCHGDLSWAFLPATGFTTTPTQFTPHYFPRYFCNSQASLSLLGNFGRSAGDDASCGHYMGPCPLALRLSAANASFDPDSDSVFFQGGKEIQTGKSNTCLTFTKTSHVEDQTLPSAPLSTRSLRPVRRMSGNFGVTPDSLAGKLTTILPTLPNAVESLVDTTDAVIQAFYPPG